MKLSRASSYAIHALAYMAAQRHDRPIPSYLVAQSEVIPEGFLLRVLKLLVSAHILHSVKGPNGGYRLVKSPREITLLDIIEAVDGPILGQSPFTDQRANGALNRKLENICKQIAVQTRRQLEKVRLSDLITSKR
jgi:Rrf2 family protein